MHPASFTVVLTEFVFRLHFFPHLLYHYCHFVLTYTFLHINRRSENWAFCLFLSIIFFIVVIFFFSYTSIHTFRRSDIKACYLYFIINSVVIVIFFITHTFLHIFRMSDFWTYCFFFIIYIFIFLCIYTFPVSSG